MFKDFDVNTIDKYLKEKFPVVLDFKFDGLLLLHGGTIKDLMMGKKESKDLDMTLLTQTGGNLKEFIEKYNIEIIREINYGYKLKYNDITIDIKASNDLHYCTQFNTDRLFYDVKRKVLIPIGIKQAIIQNEIVEYRYCGYFRAHQRKEKAKVFLTFLNHKKHHKMKYKYHRIYHLIKSFIVNPQKLFFKDKRYVRKNQPKKN